MRILVVSQYFWPENFRINDLVLGFKQQGHSVSVLTGLPNYPGGKVYDEFCKNKEQFRYYKGIKVHRVPLVPRGVNSSFFLVLNYFSFLITSVFYVLYKLRKEKFDIVFIFGVSPISVAIPGILYKKFHRAYVGLWVLDLWPDTLSDLGKVSKTSFVYKAVSWFVAGIYAGVDHVFGQSPSFVNSINMMLREGNTAKLMYNWAEGVFEADCIKSDKVKNKKGVLKILFAGNVGESQNFSAIVDTMDQCKDKPVHWYILGAGRELGAVQEAVSRLGLIDKVSFLPPVPVAEVPSYYKAADVLLVTLRAGGAFSKTIPGKVQSYMASGKPILGILDGDGNELINSTKCGLCCNAGDVDGLVSLVQKYLEMSEFEREQIGCNGLQYYRENFSRDVVIQKFFLEYQNYKAME